MTLTAAELLVPRPQRCELQAGACQLLGPVALHSASGDGNEYDAAIQHLGSTLQRAGLSVSRGRSPARDDGVPRPAVQLRLDPQLLGGRPQAYRLRIGSEAVTIDGTDAAGVFYGACTFSQWLRLHLDDQRPQGSAIDLPAIVVEDYPDILCRGLMLDISRCRVPTSATLRQLIDLMAELKLNQLQLYMEHTFAYRGHELVWQGVSPLTPDDIRALDAYGRERLVELVPNQNSFGHFHRWLRHEPYRALAECPEGVEHPFGDAIEPFSLCATDPAVLSLLADLYDQLLPCFSSRQLNVGLDETFDLGLGRSAAACAAQGRDRVYVAFMQQVHQLVTDRGHQMQYWADIVLEHPELIDTLPRDATALLWGYEADHPFEPQAENLARAGLPFYVCPGTSSWNSLAGRPTNAVHNLAAAARAATKNGAIGYLITDWGDNGHLQPLPVSYPGLLAGASAAWRAHDAVPIPLPTLASQLDHHVFDDRAGVTGQVLLAIGDAYLLTGAAPRNGTALFHLLRQGDHALDHPRYRGMTVEGLQSAHARLEQAVQQLGSATMRCLNAPLIERELRWIVRALQVACKLGEARLAVIPQAQLADIDGATKRLLSETLDQLLRELTGLWLARSRPGGRQEASSWLSSLSNALRP